MPRFLAGDLLGRIVAFNCTESPSGSGYTVSSKTIHPSSDAPSPVQAIATSASEPTAPTITACFGDGSALAGKLSGSDELASVRQWTEPRLRKGQRYIGCAVSENAVYTCTSNGALRSTSYNADLSESPPTIQKGVLPMRLCDWRLSGSATTFAYGGDEVELSVWDVSRAFESPAKPTALSEKRKRGSELLHGEIWRAKNVGNDSLSLRTPVHITSLTYLSHVGSENHLLVGTRLGNVRRYDTRAGRRPVSDWEKVGKNVGVKVVQEGSTQYEAFVADQGCNLSSLDLRTGGTIYSYKGLSGAITSLCVTESGYLASSSNDRYFRLHSTHPPADRAGDAQERKGEVLSQVYNKVAINAVAWDDLDDALLPEANDRHVGTDADSEDDESDEVWRNMEGIDEDDDEDKDKKPAKRKK